MRLTYPDPALSDGVVRLRPWQDDDLDCVRQASRERRVVQFTSVPAQFTEAAGRAFVRRQWSRAAEGAGLSLTIAEAGSDRAVGSVTLMLRPQPAVAGLGYWLVPAARGRGLAARAARLLTDWALDAAGLARVEAWVEPDNLPSRRVLAAAGFVEEGMLRNFIALPDGRADAVVCSRIPDDPPPGPPADPRPQL